MTMCALIYVISLMGMWNLCETTQDATTTGTPTAPTPSISTNIKTTATLIPVTTGNQITSSLDSSTRMTSKTTAPFISTPISVSVMSATSKQINSTPPSIINNTSSPVISTTAIARSNTTTTEGPTTGKATDPLPSITIETASPSANSPSPTNLTPLYNDTETTKVTTTADVTTKPLSTHSDQPTTVNQTKASVDQTTTIFTTDSKPTLKTTSTMTTSKVFVPGDKYEIHYEPKNATLSNETRKRVKEECDTRRKHPSLICDAHITVYANGTVHFNSILLRVSPEELEKINKGNGSSDQRLSGSTLTLTAVLASCGGLLLIIVAFLVCILCQRKSYRKNQQQLTEELQTVENGYHDNPTLEVMEVHPEMQEKKANLHGEFNDSWIVPIDNLIKDDHNDEEDTHL
uniref:Podocalyxin n=1 Tax=Lepisosteus oculatus TaxID=7918 RepID=W5NF45_LEPOC|nr:PREDICTED: podocalyxin isoform X1 [Lepisosteus oculatus]